MREFVACWGHGWRARLRVAQTRRRSSLQDALARARQYGGQIQSANLAVLQAREDTRAGPRRQRCRRSTRSTSSSTPKATERPPEFSSPTTACTFTTNRPWFTRSCSRWSGTARSAARMAAEAVAKAKVDVAARGLNATVIQDYYAIVSGAAQVRQRADQPSTKPSSSSTSRRNRKRAAKWRTPT